MWSKNAKKRDREREKEEKDEREREQEQQTISKYDNFYEGKNVKNAQTFPILIKYSQNWNKVFLRLL